MGNPESETTAPEQTPIIHFSHPHPLQLLNLPTLGPIPPCAACKLDASGPTYTCTTCSFFLHRKCSQLPQQMKHPFDRKHAFVLYPKPVYPEALFNCDACGNRGAGFSYHCSPCGADLHTTCACLPVQLSHQSHLHPLTLTFSSPYPGNSFSCDICKRVTSKTWLYRCAACEFDVHLTCVATLIPRPLALQSYGVPPGPSAPVIGDAHNVFVEMPQTSLSPPGYIGAPAGPVIGLRDQILVEAAGGVASGVAEATTQAIIQGFFGSGGGGVSYMGGGGATVDGVSYYDGGYGGGDGGYSGGESSYHV